ncbi:MAG: hypothetical protein DIU61_003735 [Bacteroidota bacterium]|jgi:hypothetical protein|nr:MAG: hypothetical protein DIU61_03195 [Bacteroidota bacterium]
MERQLDGSDKSDLYLKFTRQSSDQWEALPSPGKYFLPAVPRKFQYGNIYTQGVIVELSGKVLSDQALADLIVTHGPKAVNYLEGAFVIAVDDSRHGVWCANDPFAAMPLYYKLTSKELVITTRPENLRISSVDELNIPGIIAALSSGYPWGELTLLKEWKVLRPGHVITIDLSNKESVSGYFLPETDENVRGFQTPQEVLEAFDRNLESIASRYKRILIPLSGGVDSRLIAVRCHTLGIPFEAITFVANVPDGDDFDIASRLVKVFGVKHHRWEWNPSVENCVENFKKLCVGTGGMNDAFTSYPDGMSIFAQVASGYDCVLRGDQVFGLGEYSDNVSKSAFQVSINFWDNLDRALKPSYQGVNMEPVFEEQEEISINTTGSEANGWRHTSYRKSRTPRFLLPVGQLQAQHADVNYPFLTREIVGRTCRTEQRLRDGKLIAFETLAAGSPPEISTIPLSNQPTWQRSEPLLNLPARVINEMMDIVRQPNILSEVVDDAAVINAYNAYVNNPGGRGRASFMGSLKQMLKKALPKSLVSAYQDARRQHFKAPPHFVFKRYFAMKVFLNAISEN